MYIFNKVLTETHKGLKRATRVQCYMPTFMPICLLLCLLFLYNNEAQNLTELTV